MRKISEGPVRPEQPGGLVKYGLSRALVLVLILFVVPYLTIAVMNWDGALDQMRKSQVRWEVVIRVYEDPDLQELPPAGVQRLIDEQVQEEYRRQGLDQPFMRRNFIHMLRAITLDLGRSDAVMSDMGSRRARTILAERVWPTALLFGVAMLALFAVSVPVGLLLSSLSRGRGRFLDRLGTRLAPISVAPGWFYGIFLILIFYAGLGLLRPGGMVDLGLSPGSPGYVLSVLRHMVYPVSAILLGSVFVAIYSWRTFFVGHSNDEQVEPPRGSESSTGTVDRGSFLRPSPPRVIMYFLVMVTSLLMGSIIVEVIFNWPGLGRLLYRAIQMNDTPVILGSLVIYGYGLAFLTVMVFLLDFLDVWLIQRRGWVAAQGGK